MASLGRGIIKALAKHYGEENVIKITMTPTKDGDGTLFRITR